MGTCQDTNHQIMENKEKIMKKYETSTSSQTEERDNIVKIPEEKQSKDNKLNNTIHKTIYSGYKINKRDKEELLNEMRNNKKNIANGNTLKTEKKRDMKDNMNKIKIPTPYPEPESSEAIKEKLSIAELEIAEKIQNGSKLEKGRALEILELMKKKKIEGGGEKKKKKKKKKK